MYKPLVSVVMPVYNAEKYLVRAIESILDQTYENLEFIIVDDCSTDTSLQIAKIFARKDRRIKLFANHANLGIPKTLNKALALVKGEYYCPMDNDDISKPDRIEKELNFLLENKEHAVIGCHNEIIDESSRIIGKRTYQLEHERILKALPGYSPISHPACMIRTKVLREFGGYSENYPGSDDYDLWFKIAKKYKIANLDEILFQYRIRNDQYKSKKTRLTLLYTLQIQRKYIFRKPYLSIKGVICHLIKYPLLLLPSKSLVWLFKLIYYEKVT